MVIRPETTDRLAAAVSDPTEVIRHHLAGDRRLVARLVLAVADHGRNAATAHLQVMIADLPDVREASAAGSLGASLLAGALQEVDWGGLVDEFAPEDLAHAEGDPGALRAATRAAARWQPAGRTTAPRRVHTARSDQVLPDLVSVKEAARLLGVGESTLWRAATRKEILKVRVGRRVLIPRSEVERIAAGQEEPR